MASASELKDWETRERNLLVSVGSAKRGVRNRALDLAAAENHLANVERLLAVHRQSMPKLTEKQAAKRAAKRFK